MGNVACISNDEVSLVRMLVAKTGAPVNRRFVILGQPTDCTSLHIGEAFLTDSIIVSSEAMEFGKLSNW